MSSQRPESADASGDVLQLICARFDAELAEGALSEGMKVHAAECERCASVEREVREVTELLGQVSRPVRIDEAQTLESILDRAAVLDGRLLHEGQKRSRRAGWRIAIGALAVAAVALMTLSPPELHPPGDASPSTMAPRSITIGQPTMVERYTPLPTAVERPVPPTSAAPIQRVENHDAERRLRAEGMRQAGSESSDVQSRARGDKGPVVVPEPKVDMSAEISAMVHERIRNNPACPAKATGSVWVTMTILSDGSLTNRQIVSDGDASLAHRCVASALDELLVAPGAKTRTLSFEVAW